MKNIFAIFIRRERKFAFPAIFIRRERKFAFPTQKGATEIK